MKELFGDTLRIPYKIKNFAAEITNEEVKMVIKWIKNGNFAVSDVHGEIFKLLEEYPLTALIKLFNNIYETGYLPRDWLM